MTFSDLKNELKAIRALIHDQGWNDAIYERCKVFLTDLTHSRSSIGFDDFLSLHKAFDALISAKYKGTSENDFTSEPSPATAKDEGATQRSTCDPLRLHPMLSKVPAVNFLQPKFRNTARASTNATGGYVCFVG